MNDTLITQENADALFCFARLLSYDGPLYGADEVRAFAADCGLAEHDAYLTLLAAALGRAEDRAFLERYLRPAVRREDPEDLHGDPYLCAVRFPEARNGRWTMTHLQYAPYELFPDGLTRELPDGRRIPPLGYYTEDVRYPAVLEDGREWMAVKPNEIATMRDDILAARGKIAVFGLGLGYYVFMALSRPEVSSVTVIERDPDVIGLFRRYLLPQFPRADRVSVVRADAFDYMENVMPGAGFDFAYADLWHDAGDGSVLLPRLRALERRIPRTVFRHWIEREIDALD